MRQYLSIEDHAKASAEIIGILDAHSRLLKLLNGKVPAKILHQLLSFRGVDKATNKLRSDLEDEMFYHFPQATTDTYYPREPARSLAQDARLRVAAGKV